MTDKRAPAAPEGGEGDRDQGPTRPGPGGSDPRAARLAEALRQNLRRRKAQARARAAETGGASDTGEG